MHLLKLTLVLTVSLTRVPRFQTKLQLVPETVQPVMFGGHVPIGLPCSNQVIVAGLFVGVTAKFAEVPVVIAGQLLAQFDGAVILRSWTAGRSALVPIGTCATSFTEPGRL